MITTRGKLVFVAESFPLELARKLAALILDAQGSGELKMASARRSGAPGLASETWEPLTANLIRFFSNCGVMKAVVMRKSKPPQDNLLTNKVNVRNFFPDPGSNRRNRICTEIGK